MLMYTHICMYIHTYNGKNMDYIYIYITYIYTHILKRNPCPTMLYSSCIITLQYTPPESKSPNPNPKPSYLVFPKALNPEPNTP